MKVTCLTLPEFLECLDFESSSLGKVIRVSISRRQINEAVFEVFFQASTVVRTDEGGYLLEVGVCAGKDVEDRTQDDMGTRMAAGMKKDLARFCEGKSLALLPGVISE